jgi:hypothetical protein
MKVQQINQIISPFGGLPFVAEQIKKHGIGQFLDEQLGNRSAEATYKYSDGILATVYSHLCGSSCIEDINTLSEHIGYDPHLQLPSADTVLRMMNELKVENTITENEEVKHQFNLNAKMNNTLIKLCLKTGMIKPDADNTLDYDNVIFENEKYDAATTYKMTKGYQPGMAAIGKQVVFIEGHGGNTPASYKMSDTLEQCFELLKQNNIGITRFRSDSAAYQEDVVNTVKKYCTCFYIRANDSCSLRDAAKDIPGHEWQTVMIGNRKVEIADTPFFPFGGKTAYRVVVQRSKRKDCQGDLFTEDAYNYYGIMTDDEKGTNSEVTDFYNDRGASEKNFDALNNDFNCNHLPFSFLDANTVYMSIAAMSNTLFEWVKKIFCEKKAIAETNMRIKKFLFDFMLLPCKWIKTARQWVLKIYTTRSCYKVLLE